MDACFCFTVGLSDLGKTVWSDERVEFLNILPPLDVLWCGSAPEDVAWLRMVLAEQK